MNMVILSPSDKQSGGVEQFCFYMKKVMAEEGHTVTVVTVSDLSRVAIRILKVSRYIGMEQPALGYFLGCRSKTLTTDMIITNGLLGWNLKNVPLINVQHGTFAKAADRIDRHQNILKFFIKKYVWGFFEGLAARRATYCVAVSEETKESVIRYYGANPLVIYNAVDTELFIPMDKALCRNKSNLPLDGLIAIFVGRFEYAKGKEVLQELQKEIENAGGRLIIAEHYSQKELAILYNASDVFLLPSLHEGCSYALLDAMSCGLPFLASPVGFVADLQKQNLFSDCIVQKNTVSLYLKQLQILTEHTSSKAREMEIALRQFILTNHHLLLFKKAYVALINDIV